MKKILAMLFLSICIMVSSVPSSVIASTNKEISKKQNNISQEDIDNLFKKLGIKPLTDAQAKALKLDASKVKPFSGSLDELEKLLIQSQQPQQPITENNEIHIQVNQEILSSEDLKNLGPNLMSSSLTSSTSITRTVTDTYSYSTTPLTNARATTSMPATYQYTYTTYPAGPPEKSNYHFTSCGNGTVSVATIDPMLPYMYTLDYIIYSNGTVTSASSLRQSYQYSVRLWTAIGVPGTPLVNWVSGSGNTITGTAQYFLDI